MGLWVVSDDKYLRLRSRLRSYSIDEFLACVSRTSWLLAGDQRQAFQQAMREQGWQPETRLRDYQLAYVTKLLLQDALRPGERSWPQGRNGFEVVNECVELAAGVIPTLAVRSN